VNTYSEFRYWSPVRDAAMVRLSMANERGAEFWTSIPEDEGKSYRARRDKALETLALAIETGCEPGRVMTR